MTDIRPQTSDCSRLLSVVCGLKSTRGFTFVELLIAGTMFAILMVAVGGHLRANVAAWHRATSTTEHLQRLRVGLDRFERDLATLFVYDPSDQWPVKPEFSPDRLRAHLVRSAGTSGRVWYATYEVQPAASSASWTRTLQTIAQAVGNVPVASETLLPDVTRVDLRYGTIVPAQGGQAGTAGPITWTSSWTDPAQSPRLVEVTLELGQSWTIPRTVRRVFAVPTGGLTPGQGGSP